MGVFFDYFLAGSDEVAVSVVDSGPNEAELPLVDGKGIDPVVMMGRAEAFLTGRSYEEVDAARGDMPPLAMADGGERLVVRLPDSLLAALAGASQDRLVEVARPWSQTDEFWGHGDPDDLAEFLSSLAELAQRARTSRQRMYCWICV